jgi:hypothetical protein
MVADSSAETAIDIDTNLKSTDKVGWMILGFDWFFETVASPYTRISPHSAALADNIYCLQLNRGESLATPVFLRGGDNDLMMEDIIDIQVATSVGFLALNWPRKVRRVAFTQQETIHLLFGTTADSTDISVATIQIYCEIIYIALKASKGRGEYR